MSVRNNANQSFLGVQNYPRPDCSIGSRQTNTRSRSVIVMLQQYYIRHGLAVLVVPWQTHVIYVKGGGRVHA